MRAVALLVAGLVATSGCVNGSKPVADSPPGPGPGLRSVAGAGTATVAGTTTPIRSDAASKPVAEPTATSPVESGGSVTRSSVPSRSSAASSPGPGRSSVATSTAAVSGPATGAPGTNGPGRAPSSTSPSRTVYRCSFTSSLDGLPLRGIGPVSCATMVSAWRELESLPVTQRRIGYAVAGGFHCRTLSAGDLQKSGQVGSCDGAAVSFTVWDADRVLP